MFTYLKSSILTEKLVQTPGKYCNSLIVMLLINQYCSVLQEGCAFRDRFLSFEMAIEVSGTEHDERPLL